MVISIFPNSEPQIKTGSNMGQNDYGTLKKSQLSILGCFSTKTTVDDLGSRSDFLIHWGTAVAST